MSAGGEKRKLEEETTDIDPSKRQREDEKDYRNYEKILPMRVLLEKSDTGSLIGKAGATIKKFRQDSSIQVDIGEQVEGARKRVVTIRAGLEKTIEAAMWMASTIALRRQEKKKETEEVADLHYDLTLLMFNPLIGCVIGKGGAGIKEIRTTCGADIRISKECLLDSTEKTVQILGNYDQWSRAVRYILQLIWDGYDKVTRRAPPQVMYQPLHEVASLGAPAGAPPSLGQYPYMPFVPPQGPTRGGILYATQDPVYRGLRTPGPRPRASIPSTIAYPPQDSHLGYPVVDEGAGTQTLDQSQAAAAAAAAVAATMPTEQVVVPVPENMIGLIIGRGGSTIAEIRSRSGAQIVVEPRKSRGRGEGGEQSNDRKITITGTRQVNEVATALISAALGVST